MDVGYNLLDYRLRADDRVTVMERVNARFLRPEDFPQRPSFGATDVSFISLEAVLPAALAALDGANRRFVALVKPQFEAPREDVGEKGVVRDEAVHRRVLKGSPPSCLRWAGNARGWIFLPSAVRRGI